MMPTAQPLAGIRALELGAGVAGSYTGKLLADFGAEVIKVEPPTTGDPLRTAPPFVGGEGRLSAVFAHLNTNKASVTVDLSQAEGRDLLSALVGRADIVLESFTPGVLDEWGIGFDGLRRTQPRLVMTSLTPFGQTGPYASFQGEDIIVFAMSGMASQGLLGRPPLKLFGYHAQYHVGTVAAVATLGAVLEAELSQEAIHVDVAMVEAQNGAIDGRRPMLVAYQYTHFSRGRQAEPAVSTIPSSIYPASDGYVQIMTIPAHTDRMVATLGSDELADLFADPTRVAADTTTKDMVDAVLLPWLLGRTRRDAMEAAQAHRWALTSFNTPTDVVIDPQVVDREFLLCVKQSDGAELHQPSAPFRMADGWEVRRPAPALGEDNERIFVDDLGLAPDDLLSLRAAGVI